MLVTVALRTLSSLSYGSQANQAEAAQWRQDLHFFAEQAPRVHKNLYHAITRQEFDDAVKSLDERISALSRNQIITGIMRIVAMNLRGVRLT